MEKKKITIEKEVYEALVQIAAELQRQKKEIVNLNDAIRFLLQNQMVG